MVSCTYSYSCTHERERRALLVGRPLSNLISRCASPITNNLIRLGWFILSRQQAVSRDYGSHSCLLTHCSIPSGMTGKLRPAVPLGFDVTKEQRSSELAREPHSVPSKVWGPRGPRSRIRQRANDTGVGFLTYPELRSYTMARSGCSPLGVYFLTVAAVLAAAAPANGEGASWSSPDESKDICLVGRF